MKVHEMSSKIAEKWCKMSEEEKDSITKDALVELQERRLNKEIGEHKPGAVAAQDSFLTGERVQETVRVSLSFSAGF